MAGALRPLGWIGVALVLQTLFAAVVAMSGRFDYGERHAGRPILALVLVMVVASLVHAGTVLAALRRPPTLLVVLGASVVFRLTFLAAQPIQEDDFYRYLWDGKVMAEGLDPYRFSPEDIRGFTRDRIVQNGTAAGEPGRRAGDDEALARLAALRYASRANGIIFDRINHPHLATIYPIAAQLVFCATAWLTPCGADVEVHVFVLRAVMVAIDLTALVLLALLLRSVGWAPGLALIHGWCPLVLKETAGSGHIDVLAVAGVLLAFWSMRSARHALAGLGLALAVLAKLYAVLLLPLLLLLPAERARSQGGRGARAGALVTILSFGATVMAAQLPCRGSLDRQIETLAVFLSTWEIHDALFMWIRGALDMLPALDTAAARRGTRLVVGLGIAAVVAAQVACELRSRRRRRAEGGCGADEPGAAVRVLARAFAVLAIAFLLSPVGFPWYFVWSLPFVIFSRVRAWLLLPAFLQLYYLRFRVMYREGGAGAGWPPDVATFDTWVVSLEFGLFFGLWLLEVLWRWITGGVTRRE